MHWFLLFIGVVAVAGGVVLAGPGNPDSGPAGGMIAMAGGLCIGAAGLIASAPPRIEFQAVVFVLGMFLGLAMAVVAFLTLGWLRVSGLATGCGSCAVAYALVERALRLRKDGSGPPGPLPPPRSG
jgi:hypothetical protein